MRNTIIVTVVLFIAVILASIFYFGDLNKDQQVLVRPIGFLPEDTYLITSFINDETTDNIFKDYEIFTAIVGEDAQSELSNLKQKLLRNKKLSSYLSGSEIFLSFHPESNGTSTLFSIPTTNPIEKENVSQVFSDLNQKFKVNEIDTLGKIIYSFKLLNSDSVKTKNQDSIFHVLYHSNIFFASYSLDLLLKISDKDTKKLQEDQIEFFNKNNKKNSPFTVYLPQQNLPSILSEYKRNRAGDFLSQFINLNGQTVWNINYKQDALMLSGESELTDNKDQYIALFANQNKTNQELFNFFPAKTMMFIEYSYHDKKTWYSDLSKWQKLNKDQNQAQNLKQQLNKDRPELYNDLQNVFGQNFAVAEQTNSDYLGFITIQDTTKFREIINAFSEITVDSIYRFRYNNIPSLYYGKGMQAFSRPYFTIIDDHIVMANNQGTIQQYLKTWKSKDLLIGTIGFKNYEQIQGNEANVTLFLNTKNADNYLINTLTSRYRKNYRDKDNYGFQDFYSWSLQLSGNGGNFISRLNGIYKSKDRLGVNPAWTYLMKSRLINGPYVFDHSDTTQFILAQEQNHTLHAVLPNGNKLWSALLSGRIVGEIQQLPDRSLILITDRKRLYRFTTNGETMQGFSTSVTDEPSASPTIATIDNQQIIFIPSKTKILAYTMDGGPVIGWDDIQVEGNILGPITIIGNQIVFSTVSGKVYFFDHLGKKTNEINIPGNKKLVGPLGIVKTENGTMVYGVQEDGNVFQLQANGAIKIVFKGEWNTDFNSVFSNISGQSDPELIITDDSYMQVYQLGDSLDILFDYTFTQKINDGLSFFPVGSDKKIIGLSTKGTNLIYLFNENGTLKDGFPVESQPLFYYGKINYNSGNYLISTKRDYKLYGYPH